MRHEEPNSLVFCGFPYVQEGKNPLKPAFSGGKPLKTQENCGKPTFSH
jgi:hypothetical protein